MPERTERLRATLAELETELRELPAVDIETRAVLEAALAEISTVLNRTSESVVAEPIGAQSTAVREPSFSKSQPAPHDDGGWRETVADFEVSHPHVAGLLRRVINALAQIGI